MPISAYQILNVLNNYSRQIIENKTPHELKKHCLFRADGMRQSIIEKVSANLIRDITEKVAKESNSRQGETEEKRGET